MGLPTKNNTRGGVECDKWRVGGPTGATTMGAPVGPMSRVVIMQTGFRRAAGNDLRQFADSVRSPAASSAAAAEDACSATHLPLPPRLCDLALPQQC